MKTAKLIINRCGLAGIILLVFVLNACQSDPKNSQAPTSEEIEQLWQSLPIHQEKVQIDKVLASTDSQISIEAKYKTDASFDEIQQFYVDKLPLQGWQLTHHQEIKDRGRIKGERIIEFQQGEYSLLIQFADQRREAMGWDYAIRLAYPPDWRKRM